MKHSLIVLVTTFLGCLIFCVAAEQVDDKHCECIEYDCGCCTNLQVKNILDGNLCSNFSYLPEEYGISVTITYNGVDIFNETISAKNPPALCVIHFDKLHMEICLRFYHLDVKNKCFSGCAEFEISFFKILPLKKIKLGCFGCETQQSLSTKIQRAFNEAVDYLRYQSKHNEEEPKVVLI
ncbi:uncharacterized protein LOC100680505 [Nasonia vitripennis]|uniref:DUF4773 domain-containing protein n=1 Tax=Nasonia vitripennis TaxID=7425 RepID=A0A7M7GEQ5_NASVI|nr:uncharacterized protein LOC100680505 [Nasonia vitripennis]